MQRVGRNKSMLHFSTKCSIVRQGTHSSDMLSEAVTVLTCSSSKRETVSIVCKKAFCRIVFCVAVNLHHGEPRHCFERSATTGQGIECGVAALLALFRIRMCPRICLSLHTVRAFHSA